MKDTKGKIEVPVSKSEERRLAIQQGDQEFHFAGGGVYKNMVVYAPTREEAEAIYIAKREPCA